ncbi:unnamed protein product [Larinioides sclopetarius]
MANYIDILYVKPYTRIGPYLVGLLLASYVCRRTRNNSPSLNWLTLLVGWIVASFILLTCKFGFHDQDFTNVEASFYNALIRVAFASGLGWVIFVCVVGQGGVVNSILSWKAMIPLSRITYCSYLVHRIILMIYLNSSRELIIYTDSNMVILYLAILVMTYAVALVTSLLFEVPVLRLETLIRNKLAPRKETDITLTKTTTRISNEPSEK